MGGLGGDGIKVHLLELADLGGLDLVQVATDTSVQNTGLVFDSHGHVLLLLKELGQFLTSIKELLGGSIQIGAELSESGDFTILGELELEGTSKLLHGLDLSGGADTRHGKTDVNCGTDTLMEELGLKEDMSIRDRDKIGWDGD